MTRRVAAGWLALCLLTTACGCHVAAERAAREPAVQFGFALDGYPLSTERLRTLAAPGHAFPDLVVFYLQWPAPALRDAAGFPTASVEAIRAAGAMPCITWEPMYIEDGSEHTIPVADITNGTYDAFIRTFAEQATAWGFPVLVRFAHEMNLSRYHWGTAASAYGPDSPNTYVAMFRHVVRICRQAGNTNLRWVFCPNAESVPSGAGNDWNSFTRYYPGHDYVDVVGLDGYNWGASRNQAEHGWTSRPRTFHEIFADPARTLRPLAPGKPLFVFETASVGSPAEKRAWLQAALSDCAALDINGLVWFQVNKELDWTVPVTAALGARQAARQPNDDMAVRPRGMTR